MKHGPRKLHTIKEVPPRQKYLELRILATTDIHMQFLGHDYTADCALPHHGLAGLATLIEQARREAETRQMACVLFDNGDMLQGSALGDHLAQQDVSEDHPVVRCLNEIGFDALGVGNHDLDYGFTYLTDIADFSTAPLIGSNLQATAVGPLKTQVLINKQIAAGDAELRIGVLSVLPDQTAVWNRHMLDGHAKVTSAQDSAIKGAKHLRESGVDLVILLAHMGVESRSISPSETADARTLAALPGINAVIAGHTHRRLPGQDHIGFAGVDVLGGLLGNCPAVMPGFNGSDLAVLDLKLIHDDKAGWQVGGHHTELRANSRNVPAHAAITAICTPAHIRTRAAMAQPVGDTATPIHNFFSLVAPTATSALVALAMRHVVQQTLKSAPMAGLPLLAAVSAHTAGGRSGPGHFVHIKQGPILRRHLAGLGPYANNIWVLRVTGADLQRWLEHSAGVFTHLQSAARDQPLIMRERPTFDFDTIYGLTYSIDPSQPPGARIAQLRHAGRPVSDDQPFALVTTSFRAAGGGGGSHFGAQDILFKSDQTVESALVQLLSEPAGDLEWQQVPWRIVCAEPRQAVIQTAPDALQYLGDITAFKPQALGDDAMGFACIRLTF